MDLVHAARVNIRTHLRYIGYWRATGIGLPETGCRMLILPPRRISPAWIFLGDRAMGRERDGKELVRPDKIAVRPSVPCSRTGCRAFVRTRSTRISISRLCFQGTVCKRKRRRSASMSAASPGKRHSASTAAARRLACLRCRGLHGLAGLDASAALRSAKALAGDRQHTTVGYELWSGWGSACRAAQKSAANISVYARGRDYHSLIKGKLKMLGSWLAGEAREPSLRFSSTPRR